MALDFKIVQNYAQALLKNAKANSKEEIILEQLQVFIPLMVNIPLLERTLLSPVLDKPIKEKLVDSIVAHYKFDKLLNSFLHVVIKHSRCDLLPQITETYNKLILDLNGTKPAKITSAFKLTSKQIKVVQKILEDKIGHKVTLEDKVDESLLGGIIMEYNSNLIDCSVVGAIDRIEKLAQRTKI
ncbi:MAG: ATP synthase F1 subunit delta [Rickettsiaceae bacterium]|nr:ATP synthase F1 subunit delta [Rickettsiaceae bacterium]